jgi:hypothetical protein
MPALRLSTTSDENAVRGGPSIPHSAFRTPHSHRRTTLSRAQCSALCFPLLLLANLPLPVAAAAPVPQVAIRQDEAAGRVEVLVEGNVAFAYRFGPEIDLPYYVLFSPTGKQLTVERTDPYPHHRCFWFADTVQLEGKRKVSFYNAWYSRLAKDDPKSPFNDWIQHVAFDPKAAGGHNANRQWHQPVPKGLATLYAAHYNYAPVGPTEAVMNTSRAVVETKLQWLMDRSVPVLDESRLMTIRALGGAEYFFDVTFVVRASYGDVTFLSDAVHYAWPFLRMTPGFSVDKGGTLTNSEGGVNQKETNMKEAAWVDYSNTLDGAAEGVAVFSHPDNAHPHKWLTRDYGCFGPRRTDEKSGKQFVLKKDESMAQRVGILVHRGDVKSGKVAARYEQYVNGELASQPAE